MKKIALYIAFIISIAFVGCSQDEDEIKVEKTQNISLFINPVNNIRTKVIDDDNLASEQTINDLSIFLTDPSTDAITNKYIHQSFTSAEEGCKIISLPITPDEAQTKDIYVVANFNDAASLNALSSIAALKQLATPQTDATNLLDPAKGFAMFGETLNFNFTTQTETLVPVEMVRTVAKIRVKLTFADTDYIGTNNSFLIENAAQYTFLDNSGSSIPSDAYFNYTTPVALNRGANSQEFNNTTYIYESGASPIMNVSTTIGNPAEVKQYTINLPQPERNHLYDVDIQIFKSQPTPRNISSQQITFSHTIRKYDKRGIEIKD